MLNQTIVTIAAIIMLTSGCLGDGGPDQQAPTPDPVTQDAGAAPDCDVHFSYTWPSTDAGTLPIQPTAPCFLGDGPGTSHVVVDPAGDYILTTNDGSSACWCFADGTGCRPIP